MKRYLKVLLSIGLIIGGYSQVWAQATLSISKVNATPDASVSVAVDATGIKDMQGFQFTIAYDATKLEYLNCSNWGGGAKESGVLINPLDGKVTFVYNDDPINIVSGKFFDLNFKVKDGASGDAIVSWSDDPTARELSNSIPEIISCTYTNGAVSITTPSVVKADFSVDTTEGVAPLKVQFTDKSTGNPTSWVWDFDNDGTINSITPNPSWTYTEPGLYSVALYVSNAENKDTLIKTDYIDVRVNIPDTSFKAAINGYLQKSADYNPTIADLNGITGKFIVTNSHISSIEGAQYLTNINWLDLSFNQISDISPLSELLNLTYLKIDNNQISDISVLSNLTNLIYLYLHNNQISNINALSGLTHLTTLYLSGNKISDISVIHSLKNLSWLYIADNQISDISPLSGMASLTQLQLANNLISNISALSGLNNLVHLIISDNQISDISILSGLSNLHELAFSNNQICNISAVSNLTRLTYLDISSNQINDLSLVANLTKLTYLGMEDNRITDIASLVANSGLNSNAFVSIAYNGKTDPLSKEALSVHIPALQKRGVGGNFPSTPNNIAPCYPEPYRNAITVPINTELKWQGNFEREQVTYEVWMGNTKDSLKYFGNAVVLTNPYFSFSPTLKSHTNYWWRVRAITANDTLWSGLWHFTTEGTTNLKANFTASDTSTMEGDTVHFTDQSTGNPTSWLWYFGDGGTSTDSCPAHIYQNSGKYSVSLKVANQFSSDSITLPKYIIVNKKIAGQSHLTDSLQHYYKFDGNLVDTVGAVNGIDHNTQNDSSGIINQCVRFAGNNSSYIETNNYSAFNYCHDGSDFTISVWEKHNTAYPSSKYILGNDIGGDRPGIFFKVDSTDVAFTVGRNYPYPAFIHTWDSVLSPDTTRWNHLVITYDHSLDSSQYTLFVNGVNRGSSSRINPCETGNSYNPMRFGINKIWGTLQPFKGELDELGFWDRTLTAFEVSELYNKGKGLQYPFNGVQSQLKADFSADTTSGTAPFTVHFTDKSLGNPTSWKWDFGDGSTSKDQNPKHTYNDAGNYTVKLTVTNKYGTNTKSKTNYITAGSVPVTDFSGTPTSGAVPLTVTFADKSTGQPTSWKWDFGDGITSTDSCPEHVYKNPGKYSVALKVTNQYNTDSIKKTDYISVVPNRSNHFKPVWSGNPYQPMNILVKAADINGVSMKQNDEIGVFVKDQKGKLYCVGDGILTGPITDGNAFNITVSADDPTTTQLDGFITGDSIYYELWGNEKHMIFSNVTAHYTDGFDKVFTPLGTAIVDLSGYNHYKTVWSGNPYNPMNILIDSIELADSTIKPGDEVGVFDKDDMGNEICVGAATISAPPSSTNPLSVVVSSDDPSTKVKDGFIISHKIIYKVWTPTSKQEYTNFCIKYNSTLDSLFKPKGTALVSLTYQTSIIQNITFSAGWNMMSFNVVPDTMSMTSLLRKIMTDGHLIKVIDEKGGFIQNIPGVGWMNTIGNMANTEGYYVKVSATDTLTTSGKPVALPFDIPMQTGWNMMGYPLQGNKDAKAVLKKLIDSSFLVKAINEAGGFIQNIPGVGWMNTIGNFEPGEGYYVKVNKNCNLTLNDQLKQSPAKSWENTITVAGKSKYFNKAFTGNPYYPMNIVVTNIDFPGYTVQPGDEIAAFDNGICVGTGIVSKDVTEPVNVVVSKDDPLTSEQDGYRLGDEIILKYMSSKLNTPITVTWNNPIGPALFTPLETTVCGISALPGVVKKHMKVNSYQFRMYPNPAKSTVTVEIYNNEQAHVSIEITDLYGKIIKTLDNKTMSQGSYQFRYNTTNLPSGIYEVRVIRKTDKQASTDNYKLVITK